MTKRADGRYQKKIILSNGKQKIVYGKSPAAVNAAARALLAEGEAGLEIGDHTLVGEWAKTWLESYKMTLRYSTIRMYRNAYNKHIMPATFAPYISAGCLPVLPIFRKARSTKS